MKQCYRRSVNKCMMQASSAILKLQQQVIKWPDVEERKWISGRISKAHGFLHCVVLIDGTLFLWPLLQC